MAASAGNVFNTLGTWSLTINLIGLGVTFVMLLVAALWAFVDYARRRDDPVPTPFSETLKLVATLVGSMAMVGLMGWLGLKGMKSKSAFGRRFRQFSGVSLLL